MHVSARPLFVAGAVLAIQAASATPIRVIAVTSNIQVISPPNDNNKPASFSEQRDAILAAAVTRVGLAGAGATAPVAAMRKGCAGKKSIALSNTLRKKLGLPTIEGDFSAAVMPDDGSNVDLHPDASTAPTVWIPHPHPMYIPPDEQVADDPSLAERVHAAFVQLGPWEARAVAFVLGCGIGVLLRMIWIFAVLVVREVTPSHSEEQAAEEVHFLVLEGVTSDELPEYADDKAPAYAEKTGMA